MSGKVLNFQAKKAKSSLRVNPAPSYYTSLLWAYRNDPTLSHKRQIALDLDEIVFPMTSAISKLPGGEEVNYKTCEKWESVLEILGRDQAFELIFEATRFENARKTGTFGLVKETLKELKRHRVQVHIMTSREYELKTDTERYLKFFKLPHDSLTLGPDLDKVSLCKERGIEVLVDDKPQTIQAASQAGLSVVTLSYLYNQQVIDSFGVPAARSWRKLARLITEELGKRIEPEIQLAQCA